MNHTGANRVKVRGRSRWGGFTGGFFLHLELCLMTEQLPPSAATDATISFLVCTFLTVIVLANFDFFFFFFFASVDCERQWEQSQKYHCTEGDIRGARPGDGELWRSSLISELPRRDKGPLKSQETEQSKSRRTFQEKQHATETQHDPGRAASEHLIKALAEQVLWIISKEWWQGWNK